MRSSLGAKRCRVVSETSPFGWNWVRVREFAHEPGLTTYKANALAIIARRGVTSEHVLAAVDAERGTGDESGLLVDQKGHRMGDLVRSCEPAEGNLRDDAL